MSQFSHMTKFSRYTQVHSVYCHYKEPEFPILAMKSQNVFKNVKTSKHVVINQRRVYVEAAIVCVAIVNISKPSGFLEFKPHSGE